MNIYLQELRMSVRSALYWTIGLLLTLFLFMMMFPTISKEAGLMQQVLSKFPPELMKAFGLSTLDFSTILGFYGFLFIYILLIGSIYAMKSGFSVLSEEIRTKTSDFLVTKPVSRLAIVTAKMMNVLTYIVIQNIIYIAGAFFIAHVVSDQAFNQKVFLLINVSLMFVQLFFVALGLFLSVMIRRIKTVLPITLGVVFGFFVLQLLNQTLGDAKLSYLTPFAYYDVSKIIKTTSYEPTYLIFNWVVIIIFIALTYIVYHKKDMPSV